MTTKIHSVPNTAATTNPGAGVTDVAFKITPWQPKSEFDRFTDLTKKLVNTPKPEKETGSE